eukprot:165358-Chlamydomonas_euryale.AAC.4
MQRVTKRLTATLRRPRHAGAASRAAPRGAGASVAGAGTAAAAAAAAATAAAGAGAAKRPPQGRGQAARGGPYGTCGGRRAGTWAG